MSARDLMLTTASRAARNAALLALADAGAEHSAIVLYAAPQGALLAARRLAKPCGAVRDSDGRIQLQADADATDLVAATGAAAWGEWVAGDGTLLAAGQITDAAGNATDAGGALVDTGAVGPWVLTGTAGTQLYAGGVVLLSTAVIG